MTLVGNGFMTHKHDWSINLDAEWKIKTSIAFFAISYILLMLSVIL